MKILFRFQVAGGNIPVEMNDEVKWMADYLGTRSDSAFEALVRLHLPAVLGTALRQVGERGLAEEITQNVFVILSQKASSLDRNRTLAGWLYQTTINQSRHALRTHIRRQSRELKAGELAAIRQEGESPWKELLSLVDEALLDLREPDRLAVVLHFMEERPFRDVGQALGVGEDAARKRVDRVVTDLKNWFQKRGFTVPTGSFAAVFGCTGKAEAAAALVAKITSAVHSAARFTAAPNFGFWKIMASTKAKIGAATLLALLVLAPAGWLKYNRQPGPTATQNIPAQDSQRPQPRTLPDDIAETGKIPRFGGGRIGLRNNPGVGPAKNIFERINDGDESVSQVSNDQIQTFLSRNKTNAESLLAAFKVSHDLEFLRQAATNFPNDPAVLFRVVAHNAFPEERREWLEQFKKADPTNAIPHYLAAQDLMKQGDVAGALQELKTGTEKPAFKDYLNQQMQTLEELYAQSGHSPAESKALGMAAIEMPHVGEMGRLSRALADLSRQYQAAGDQTSAEQVVQLGLALSQHVKQVQDHGNLLGEAVSLGIERNVLRSLDPSRQYAFLGGGVVDRIAQSEAQDSAVRQDAQFFEKWIGTAAEPEIVNFYDRVKLYGEKSALQWAKTHPGSPQ